LNDDIRYWLALRRAPDTGDVNIRRLVEHFGSPQEVFLADRAALSAAGITNKNRIETLATFFKSFSDWEAIDDELGKVSRMGARIISLLNDDYPELLKNIANPPVVLYVKGTLQKDDVQAVAVVGSRLATNYGLQQAEKLSCSLAQKGLTIVSGLASGIDSAAHKATIRAGGRTIAVLGCGLDVIYPPKNSALYFDIAASGAVISEFQLGTSPERGNFPRRNRLISGLSLGTIVVEAAARSGSLITASYALEQGREVFAVPGSVNAPTSKGTNKLLKQGARLVEDADDIISELSGVLSGVLAGLLKEKKATHQEETVKPRPELTGDEEALLSILAHEPRHVDEIVAEGIFGTAQSLSLLLALELKGLVHQDSGMQFRLA